MENKTKAPFRLILLIFSLCLCVASVGAKAKSNGKILGLPKKLMPMLACSACTRVMERHAKSLSQLIQSNQRWKYSLKTKVWNMVYTFANHFKIIFFSVCQEYSQTCFVMQIRLSCSHDDDFPSNNEPLKKGCAYFMSKYYPRVLFIL